MATYPLALDLLNKVPELGYTKLVGSPAVVTYPNAPLGLQIRVLSFVNLLCFEDEVGRDCPAHRVDRSN